MADVFISYARKDRKAAEIVVERLEQRGWTVWWDKSLSAGERWDESIRLELASARCVVVLWSKHSWSSKWVQAEAHSGFSRDILVAGILDSLKLEPPFNILQASDLKDREGIEKLLAGVTTKTGSPTSQVSGQSSLSDRDLPPLQGHELKVRLARRPAGITLFRADDGSVVTDRRALTQGELARVPDGDEQCTLVNVNTNSGELVSCIIAGPSSEVYGNERAFWWSLARVNLNLTSALIYGSGLRRESLARACVAAQSAWECATREQSIGEMRDSVIFLRDRHFSALSQMIDQASDWETEVGYKIARAMVLAIQSEDSLLERAAYCRFRKYLWVPGGEPEDFARHDQIS